MGGEARISDPGNLSMKRKLNCKLHLTAAASQFDDTVFRCCYFFLYLEGLAKGGGYSSGTSHEELQLAAVTGLPQSVSGGGLQSLFG